MVAKTLYSFMHFTCISDSGKTTVWEIRENKSDYLLGTIRWYSPWRTYCIYTYDGCIFNTACLKDILDFIKHLLDDRKNKKKEKK